MNHTQVCNKRIWSFYNAFYLIVFSMQRYTSTLIKFFRRPVTMGLEFSFVSTVTNMINEGTISLLSMILLSLLPIILSTFPVFVTLFSIGAAVSRIWFDLVTVTPLTVVYTMCFYLHVVNMVGFMISTR